MKIIGLDLGGTKLAGAIFSKEGKILEKKVVPLKKRQGTKIGGLIKNQIRQLLPIAKEREFEINGIGISVPGIYYSRSGNVWAPNISGWEKYPLLEDILSLSEVKNINVKIDSDRACYILGETWQGNAKGCKDAIFLAVGTGIGAGILTDGKILRGASDIAGAIGWMALDRPFHRKYKTCGCFEYQASGDGIAGVAREFLKNQENDYIGMLREKNIEKITSHDVFNAYQQSDPIAISVLENCIELWGMSVANLVSLFNPEKIIFGGGVFGPAAQFLEQIRNEACKWAQPISMNQVRLEISALAGDAGLFGAAQLALIAINDVINENERIMHV